MDPFTTTDRTRVRRLPQRATYDREAIYAILDEAMVCHVAFCVEGRPVVIPTLYARSGDTLYVHGSAASRMVRSLEQGIDVSIAVTLVDGLVLARSAFHHSMNYRSIVIFGTARLVEGEAAKTEALRVFTEHVAPGRWDVVRRPSVPELKGTTVLAIALDEISAKVRTGPPVDDEEDLAIPVWAGVLPLRMTAGVPLPDAATPPGAAPHPTPARFQP